MNPDPANLFTCYQFGDPDRGPRLLITAGVHGDEVLPMLAVKALIQRFESDVELCRQIRGEVILIPVVNRSAAVLRHRCGRDGLDLARTFPGDHLGTVTQRVASALSHRIGEADYYIDLHTGGRQLCVFPLCGYMLHPDPNVLQTQRQMASAFRLPLVWGTSASLSGRTLSVARDALTPAVYVEYLGGQRERDEITASMIDAQESDHPLVAGCLAVMRQLDMLDGPNDSRRFEHSVVDQEVIEDWRSDSGHLQICNPAPATGRLQIEVDLGQRVSRGERLATLVSDIDGAVHSIKSSQEGMIVVVRDVPRIEEGQSVAVIAERCDST